MMVDRHTIALISIAGSCLDVLGALYLAYDLLGGEHGPLRTLTRAVTYGALFGGATVRRLGYTFGAPFGITFGVLSSVGQAIAYRLGIRPTIDYKPATRPRISRLQLLAAANRTVGYTVTGYLSSLVAHQREHAIAVGVEAGLTIGLVTAIAGSCTPLVEWTADHVPEKRMGVFGVGLILVGFSLQSVQYWLALLDVTVR